ncbi:tripartite tricarboxylate transporter substrate binding protein [Achromobacter sp. SD115]|uniref:Bug family tripartite tricarboxylate transporter substrate binding protein n=1 Tax=Achromobacter sp. SD115 TaxID=2782011 RepID=UPI001A95743F|nr:tripartite tricarboxylate transporter substrate binding protein [Achromobacter sp. SD115]MBO1012014.1 tripartite tricarboxylate transporter substrate binding protein [Achromobacter sp. SD115]
MKNAIRILACATLALGAVWNASAQDFPNKSIQIVVPFPPGGVADLVVRTVAQKLGQDVKQPVLVVNKPGASGIIGAEFVARAPADGYTLLLANLPIMSINELQYSSLPYSAARDFAPVILLADQPYIIATGNAVPAKTMKEFIAYAKSKPDTLTFGSASSSTFLAGELFKQRAGIRMAHIPYKGSAPAINDLLGGHISLILDPVITLLPHVQAGKLRALAVTSSERIDSAPDIPSYKEVGLADMDITSWQGIVAPAGTPEAVVKKLNQDFNRALQSPEVASRLKEQGVSTKGGSAQAFTDFVAAENKRWATLAKQVNFLPGSL